MDTTQDDMNANATFLVSQAIERLMQNFNDETPSHKALHFAYVLDSLSRCYAADDEMTGVMLAVDGDRIDVYVVGTNELDATQYLKRAYERVNAELYAGAPSKEMLN